MFAAKDFMLSRLDDICEFAGIEFADLARAVEARDSLLTQLPPEQEKELADDAKLMLLAVASIHDLTFEQIIGSYQLTETELIGLLTRLDRLKLVELQANNRIKPLVARVFTWLPQGPIQMFFLRPGAGGFFPFAHRWRRRSAGVRRRPPVPCGECAIGGSSEAHRAGVPRYAPHGRKVLTKTRLFNKRQGKMFPPGILSYIMARFAVSGSLKCGGNFA